MPHLRSTSTLPVTSLCAALAMTLAIGCATEDAPVASSSPEVSRLDFADGASVDFQRGGGVVATAGADAVNPLDGLALDGITPAALYEALSGQPAPASLQTVAKDGGPAITGVCPPNADYCGFMQHWPQTIRSSERLDRVVGQIHVTSGSLRVRVFSTSAGADDLLKTLHLGPSDPQELNTKVSGHIDRKMYVVIDNVSLDATYDLWLDWQG